MLMYRKTFQMVSFLFIRLLSMSSNSTTSTLKHPRFSQRQLASVAAAAAAATVRRASSLYIRIHCREQARARDKSATLPRAISNVLRRVRAPAELLLLLLLLLIFYPLLCIRCAPIHDRSLIKCRECHKFSHKELAAYAASTALLLLQHKIQVKPVMTTTAAADDDYHDDENEYQHSDPSFYYQITKSFRVYIATAAATAVAATAASVNGQDVSNSSHEDAVRCFESAQEPILVEVLRRQQSSSSHTTTPTTTTTTTTALTQHNSNGNGNVSGSSPSTSSQSSSPHDDGTASSGINSSSPAQQQQQPQQQMDENSRENAFTLLVSTAVQTDWAGLVDDDEDDDEFGVTLRPQDADEQTNDSLDDILAHDIDFEVRKFLDMYPNFIKTFGRSITLFSEVRNSFLKYIRSEEFSLSRKKEFDSSVATERAARNKEVTLRKVGSAEKLGLTVCYSSGSEDADTEVYISEIVPESLAARDGRLREGDQILRKESEIQRRRRRRRLLLPLLPLLLLLFACGIREWALIHITINGKDVASKEQTENLFAETKNSVTILVSRCVYGSEAVALARTRRGSSMRFATQELELLDNNTSSSSPLTLPPPPPAQQQQQQATTPAYQNSTIEQLIKQQQLEQQQQPRPESPIPPAPPVHGIQPQQVNGGLAHKLDGLSLRGGEAYTGAGAWSETEHIYETIPESDSEPIYSSPYEHHMQHLQLKGQQLLQQQQPPTTTTTTTTATQVRNDHPSLSLSLLSSSPRTRTAAAEELTSAMMLLWQNNGGRHHSSSKSNSSGEEKDSSSAYNTGESCNSNTLTLELQQQQQFQLQLQQQQQRHRGSTLVLCPPGRKAADAGAILATSTPKIQCHCSVPVGPPPTLKPASNKLTTSSPTASTSAATSTGSTEHQRRPRRRDHVHERGESAADHATPTATLQAGLEQQASVEQVDESVPAAERAAELHAPHAHQLQRHELPGAQSGAVSVRGERDQQQQLQPAAAALEDADAAAAAAAAAASPAPATAGRGADGVEGQEAIGRHEVHSSPTREKSYTEKSGAAHQRGASGSYHGRRRPVRDKGRPILEQGGAQASSGTSAGAQAAPARAAGSAATAADATDVRADNLRVHRGQHQSANRKNERQAARADDDERLDDGAAAQAQREEKERRGLRQSGRRRPSAGEQCRQTHGPFIRHYSLIRLHLFYVFDSSSSFRISMLKHLLRRNRQVVSNDFTAILKNRVVSGLNNAVTCYREGTIHKSTAQRCR
ncbi:unnamed protein product [Trichogramma brassicae]|uniref:PDZ domain-containing protein n=1 Tax=Trichogramma brassicae TaxID=86971 RepID=A0A6H5IUE8_9HYME|nr:unnamed protein product [Trichogramma brassicae]